MFNPNFILLYVDDVRASVAFYSQILETKPVEDHPSFALFICGPGLKFGLWLRTDVQPPASAERAGGELVFGVPSREEVQQRHSAWAERGVRIAQAPTQLDFGYTFVALDPDGNRLRVYTPDPE